MSAQAEASVKAPEPLGLLTKLLFGLGQTVEIVKIWIFETIVLFFYSQVVGLPAAFTGVALLIAMMVDAVTDPLIGQLSDNSQSTRWGRRHRFMFGAIVPAAVFIVLLFSPHAKWSEPVIFLWLLFTAVGLRVSLTFFAIPYSAQMADLSSARSERATLTTFRMLSGTGVRYLLILFAFDLFFAPSAAFVSGQEDRSQYFPFSLFAASLVIFFGFISAVGTFFVVRSRTTSGISRGITTHRKHVLLQLLTFWAAVLRRGHNLRTLVLYSGLVSILTGIYGSLTLYFGTYYWKLIPKEIGLWAQLMLPGLAGVLLLGPLILKRVEPKLLLIVSVLAFASTLVLPVFLAEIGLYDRQDDLSRTVLYTTKLLNGCSFGGMILCIPVMASEVADEWASESGQYVPALIFGVLFFSTKAGGGVGNLLAGFGLSTIRFPEYALIRSGEASIGPDQLASLGWLFIGALTVLSVLTVLILSSGYRLSGTRHARIVQEDAAPAPTDEVQEHV